MPKFLLISGSPREGNTEFILQKIFAGLKTTERKLVLLRKQKISHCRGCLACDKTNVCAIRDDMDKIYKLMTWADIYVISTPNYFDNVPGLLKDFIDRTNPFYETDFLANKKLITIVVGGGKVENSKRICDQASTYFAAAHKMQIAGCYCFQALKANELKNNPRAIKKIQEIVEKLNKIDPSVIARSDPEESRRSNLIK